MIGGGNYFLNILDFWADIHYSLNMSSEEKDQLINILLNLIFDMPSGRDYFKQSLFKDERELYEKWYSEYE